MTSEVGKDDQGSAGLNVGVLSAVVWPTWAGSVNEHGEEPISDPDYQRSQISWGLNEQGRIVGYAKIHVPRGIWTHIIYHHHPTRGGYITAQKLAHPLQLSSDGEIELIDITDEDVKPLNPDKVLHG
jgi:hypothetical protein